MAFELIPFSDLKDFLDLEKPTINDYPALGVIIDRMPASFEEYTGRMFEYGLYDKTVYVGDTATAMVYLDVLPVESVDLVEIDGVETTDYRITGYGIKLGGKVKDVDIEITYTGGLTATTKTLKAAALYQISYEYQSKEQVGAESVSNEGGFVSRPALTLLKETKRMLRPEVHPLNTGAY